MENLKAKNKHDAIQTIKWLANKYDAIYNRICEAKPVTFSDYKYHFESMDGKWRIGDFVIEIDSNSELTVL